MDLFLDHGVKRGTTRQVYEQIRQAIAVGRLAGGDRLPPSRRLAAELGVARHTITTVYERLAAEGYTEGRAGGGTFVTGHELSSPVRQTAARLHLARRVAAARSTSPATPASAARFDLRRSIPDPALFPVEDWRRAMIPALRRPPAPHPDVAGSRRLRRVLAHWIGKSRGVECDEEHVLVTSGTHQAVDLVARVLLDPGDVVAVEEPCFPELRAIFTTLGARVVSAAVDGEGLVVSDLPPATRLVLVTPSHQFPLGVPMSIARRRELLRFADRHDTAIVEDDYDSEFRHVARPLEPLHRLDRRGRVVYVATFSKSLSPSLRLGFAVLPPSIAAAVGELRQVVDGRPPSMLQDALESFIASGALDRHLRRARRVYTARYETVADFLSRGRASEHLNPLPGCAGLHTSAHLVSSPDESGVLRAAEQRGVLIHGLADTYSRPGQRPGISIGFGAVATTDLPAALDELLLAVRTTADEARPNGASEANE
jgi:GntR family transcriptional regulator/MocR family aminotransferase